MRFFLPQDPGKKGIPARIHDRNFPGGTGIFPVGKFSYWRDLDGIPVGTGFLAGSQQDPGGYFTRAYLSNSCWFRFSSLHISQSNASISFWSTVYLVFISFVLAFEYLIIPIVLV